MAIIQVGLKSCVLPRRKRWYRSFCRTRLLLARRAQNVAKNRATCWRTGGKVLCWGTGGGMLLGRPSSNTEYSARPPTRSAIFGHVLASPGQLEPSSAKWLSPSFLSRQNTTFKPNLSNCQWIPLISTIPRLIIGGCNLSTLEINQIERSVINITYIYVYDTFWDKGPLPKISCH